MEYIYNDDGTIKYRRVYEIYHDNEELGVLLSEEAAEMLYNALIDAGAEPATTWINYGVQAADDMQWLVDCMHIKHRWTEND